MHSHPDLLPSNQLKAISDYVFTTKYARYDHKKKRRETWDEAVDRVRDMHLQRYGTRGIDDDIRWAFEQVREKKALPSMRSMQFGGQAIIANDARMYNCAYSFADRPRFFSEAFWMLLSGVGVGFSVQKHHVAKLPNLIDHQTPDEKELMIYNVGDTIEGWADALDVLMSSYFAGTPISGREVFFGFKQIRRKGTWLKTSGGRAPGASPLREALKRIKRILREAAAAGQEKLKTIQVYDIIMMFAEAVLSGGIRRSATIALFSPDDEDMMTAKSFSSRAAVLSNKRKDGSWLVDYGDGAVAAWNLKQDNSKTKEPSKGEEASISWSNTMPWRARSNNSAVLVRDKCTKQQFKTIIDNAKKFGEPGFALVDNTEYGYNPCFSGDTRLLTENGYVTIKELWDQGGKQEYCKYKTAEEYGLINIINSNGKTQATNVYRTSDSSPIFEITLSNGQSIKATANHKFFRLNKNGEKERVRLDELNVGDKVPLIKQSSFGEYHNPDYALLAGWVTGDGSLSKNSNGLQRAHVVVYDKDLDHCLPILREKLLSLYVNENRSTNQNPLYRGCEQAPKGFNFKKKTMESIVLGRMMKEDGCRYGIASENVASTKHRIPNRIWGADEETICAYLRGIFSADGCVQYSKSNKSLSVRLWQANKTYLNEIQLLLSQLNINSRIYKRRNAREVLLNDGKGSSKLYNSKEQFELIITRKSILGFKQDIGFIQDYKNQKLESILGGHRLCSDVNSYEVVSIECAGEEETYCLTEIENNEVTVNGVVVGNCVEIGLNPVDPLTGESGWQVCNLCEVNGGKITTEAEFRSAVKAATIIGTLQAGYTYFNYLTDASRRIINRERLLGVSVTGWMENPDFLLQPALQRKMAEHAVDINRIYADKIGIEPAARVTCTKPAGSSAVVLQTSSGIHPHHARNYFRRVQVNSVEQPLQYFKLWNPKAVEKSAWGVNDEVITFCIQVPESAVVKDDMSALEFLKTVKSTCLNWVLPGTARPESSPGLTHNVSNTVEVAADEWDDVADFIYDNRQFFSGIALLSKSGDKSFIQAPNERVETDEDISRWNKLVSEFNFVDWSAFKESSDNTSLRETVACAGGACEV